MFLDKYNHILVQIVCISYAKKQSMKKIFQILCFLLLFLLPMFDPYYSRRYCSSTVVDAKADLQTQRANTRFKR